jgi:4-hydroxy-2-oxoheptanedioate aldolase
MSASPSMRPSRVLARLRAGEVASCFKINLSDPRAVEIAAMSGFDCLWTDMEHVPNGWEAIERQRWRPRPMTRTCWSASHGAATAT